MIRNEEPRKPGTKVHFHQEQVRYLEKIFPARVLSPTASESEMRYYFGQQSVLEVIRQCLHNN